MKKIIFILALLFVVGLSSCKNEEDNNVEEKVAVIYSGSSTYTWHVNVDFIAVVKVGIKDNVIESVELLDSSYVCTDAFNGFDEIAKEYYLNSFIGKTVDEINNIEFVDANPANAHDTGSMSGAVDAYTGATVSSISIAKAIQNACSKVNK